VNYVTIAKHVSSDEGGKNEALCRGVVIFGWLHKGQPKITKDALENIYAKDVLKETLKTMDTVFLLGHVF